MPGGIYLTMQEKDRRFDRGWAISGSGAVLPGAFRSDVGAISGPLTRRSNSMAWRLQPSDAIPTARSEVSHKDPNRLRFQRRRCERCASGRASSRGSEYRRSTSCECASGLASWAILAERTIQVVAEEESRIDVRDAVVGTPCHLSDGGLCGLWGLGNSARH